MGLRRPPTRSGSEFAWISVSSRSVAMDALALFVSVPVASFRVPQAREYFETLPSPPPSTVYGMLLSLVGEPNRLRHIGSEIAVALLSTPSQSGVLRTLWRVKSKEAGPGIGENNGPG